MICRSTRRASATWLLTRHLLLGRVCVAYTEFVYVDIYSGFFCKLSLDTCQRQACRADRIATSSLGNQCIERVTFVIEEMSLQYATGHKHNDSEDRVTHHDAAGVCASMMSSRSFQIGRHTHTPRACVNAGEGRCMLSTRECGFANINTKYEDAASWT